MNAVPVPYVAIRNGAVRCNKGEEAMPNKVKWKSVDRNTFYVYDGEAYQPPLVTYGDKPLDRDDDGPWGGEVRV